jgi:hypothetical protein
LCQDMSPSLIGFCMDDQCNCITWEILPRFFSNAIVDIL